MEKEKKSKKKSQFMVDWCSNFRDYTSQLTDEQSLS